MKNTFSATSRALLRNKTSALIGTVFYFNEDNTTFSYFLDSLDKTTPDDNDLVLVSAKGLRFRKQILKAIDSSVKLPAKFMFAPIGNVRGLTVGITGNVYYTVNGSETLFYVFDASDKKSADDGSNVLVTAKGLRYKKVSLVQAKAVNKTKIVDLYEMNVPDGLITANNLHPDFITPDISKTGNYISGPINQLLLEGKNVARDIELIFSPGNCEVVYLRVANDRGLSFSMKRGGGHARISIDNSCHSGTWDFNRADLVYFAPDSMPDKFALLSNSKEIVFGAVGFDIYLKADGIEVWRSKQIDCVQRGNVLAKGFEGRNDMGNFKVNYLADTPLKSDTDKRIFDIEDYELFPDMIAKGSIIKNSNKLQLKKGHMLRAKDPIIIPTGFEAPYTLGNGTVVSPAMPGNMNGVGGFHPYRVVKDYSELQKLDLPDGTYVTNEFDGLTYEKYAGTGNWYPKRDMHQVGGGMISYNPYTDMVLSIAFRANILSIDANNIATLDRPAKGTATDADIMYDASPTLNAIFNSRNYYCFFDFMRNNQLRFNQPDFNNVGKWTRSASSPDSLGWTVLFGNGSYYISDEVSCYSLPNMKIISKGETKWIAPKGCPTASYQIYGSENYYEENLTIVGNAIESGRGLLWWQNNYSGNDYTANWEGYIDYPNRCRGIGNCKYFEIHNPKVYNTFTGALGMSGIQGGLITNAYYQHDEGVLHYSAWGFVFDKDCANVVINGLKAKSPTTFKIAQTFNAGKGNKIINFELENCLISTNSGKGGINLENGIITHKKNSLAPWIAFREDIIFFGSNAYAGDHPDSGSVKNVKIVHEGYVDEHLGGHSLMSGINVNPTATNVLIDGLEWESPNGHPASDYGPIAITSTGVNLTVRNVKVIGKVKSLSGGGNTNIMLNDGSLENIEADSVTLSVNGQSGKIPFKNVNANVFEDYSLIQAKP